MSLPLPLPVFDANATTGSFGDLPDWDLTDLYPAPDSAEFARDMAALETGCAAFAVAYEGKLGRLDAAGLLACVTEYERIDILAGRLMSYAGLRYYQNTMDSDRAKFSGDAQDRVTTATTPLVFFSLEFNRLDDDHLARLNTAKADITRYRPVLDKKRAKHPNQQ